MSSGGMKHLLEGMMMFRFIPKVLAGFGPPLHVTRGHSIPACGGEGSGEGKPQGKAKRLLQHLAGTIPCLFLLVLPASAQSCLGTTSTGMGPRGIGDFGLQPFGERHRDD